MNLCLAAKGCNEFHQQRLGLLGILLLRKELTVDITLEGRWRIDAVVCRRILLQDDGIVVSTVDSLYIGTDREGAVFVLVDNQEGLVLVNTDGQKGEV